MLSSALYVSTVLFWSSNYVSVRVVNVFPIFLKPKQLNKNQKQHEVNLYHKLLPYWYRKTWTENHEGELEQLHPFVCAPSSTTMHVTALT